MTERPVFFEAIRQKAAARWDQLEHDRELAGPWHQLFKQVQSPRHVLSELLQNADDAGAREASAWIENDVFCFEHDGEDFVEEHFASLCRFGYSNKRDLHTIGFRGIGFKSTFSLGDRVEVHTPTLSVDFDCRRFTEPRWLGGGSRSDGKTCIRVVIKDDHRRREVEQNIEEWKQSPLSLLFFKHIRRMHVGAAEVHWTSNGAGPVPDSEWMTCGGMHSPAYLLIRSKAESFSKEAQAEIRQERLLRTEEEADFPPCKVEIVLGAKGRLFVVLPTGVETALPFACNAPFIQDPARLKIKDPGTSPTNRWLLRRAGELAATTMLGWLNRTDIPDQERAGSYRLFPDVNRDDNSLNGICGAHAGAAFAENINGQRFLLADDGSLVASGQCVALPEPILELWSSKQAVALFDEAGRPALSRQVAAVNRQTLLKWRVVEDIDKPKVLRTLQSQHLPRPETKHHLLTLWGYVAPDLTDYNSAIPPGAFRIFPVEGKDAMYSASEVVRIGEKKLLESESDWQFLAEHILVLDPAWPRFIADQRCAAEEQNDTAVLKDVNAAQAILSKVGLEVSADASRVIDRVSAQFIAKADVGIAERVHLAQVAAKLGATAGLNFRYVARNGSLRAPKDHILFDENGSVEELVPQPMRDSLLLHSEYTQVFSSCTREEWTKWVTTGRSGLHSFPPLVKNSHRLFGRAMIEAEIRKRGAVGKPEFHYKTDHFIIRDWDFGEAYWSHWNEIAKSYSQIWTEIGECLVAQGAAYWRDAMNARVLHVASSDTEKSITREPLTSSGILRLRDLPCLKDTRGLGQRPQDLLRRTPQTESLMDVEAFVHSSLDREETWPLLDLLGVRATPTGPDRILECLRALATSEKPPMQEVERWYRRLDQMVDTCTTDDLQKIKEAFRSRRLILTDKGAWAAVSSVFLSPDEEDVPGAATIRVSVHDLTLWRKLGVAERPTADLAIRWLQELPSGQKLSQADHPRVRALLVRHPARVWEECGHWINLAGEWAATDQISFALTMQSLIPWSHLHEWVKQKTADLQRLSVEVIGAPPFAGLPTLAARVEDRLHRDLRVQGEPAKRAWLTSFAAELCRIVMDTEAETGRVRALARDLASTRWQRAPGLEIIPYIDGIPAGTPRRADVLWLDRVLYVNELPKAKLAKRVPEELAKAFRQQEIKAALDYSFERSPEDVRAYLEENFTLTSADNAPSDDASEDARVPDATNASNEDHETQESHDRATVAAGTADAHDAMNGTVLLTIGARADETDDAVEIDGVAVDQARPPQKCCEPSIIERFAAAQGFQKDGEARFFNAEGSWIAKTTGDMFPWERRTVTGTVVRYYWPKDHCLDHKPLVLDAEIWGLIDSNPDDYALILANSYGEPIEMLGTRLRELREQEKLKLYPAAYRLVVEGDEHA